MVNYSQSSQNSKFAVSLQYIKKEVRDEVHFLHPDKRKNFLQVDSNTLFSTRWCCHYWWALSSILKVLKLTSLQYLYNISKKKLGMEFLMEVARNVQGTQNRKLVNFLQYTKKKVMHLLLCSIVMQNIQIFEWSFSKMGVAF